VFSERTSVGLDVHARSVAAAAIDGVTGELFQARLTPSHAQIRAWIAGLPGPVAVTYEAGPTGFGLARALTADGIRCVVAAPSKLQRPAGDRVKTDAKDAVHLARLLRLDEVTAVVVPSEDQEAARDLVRTREDCRGDLMRARHRLSIHLSSRLEYRARVLSAISPRVAIQSPEPGAERFLAAARVVPGAEGHPGGLVGEGLVRLGLGGERPEGARQPVRPRVAGLPAA